MRRKALKYFQWKLNSQGLTLLECVFALFLFSLSLLVLSQAIQFYQAQIYFFQTSHHHDFHKFVFMTDYEISTFQEARVERNRIVYKNRNNKDEIKNFEIAYYKKGDGSPAQVRIAPGYQPLLIGIKSFHVHQREDLAAIRISFETGESFHAYQRLK